VIAPSSALQLARDDTGCGPPIVFLHAVPLDRSMWAPQLSTFAQSYRCLALDMRGFGESVVAPPFSMDQYATDVVTVLDALGITKATLVGLSIGGSIAFALWRRYRDRVHALVLVNAQAEADDDEMRVRRQRLIQVVQSEGSAAGADLQIGGLVGETTRARNPTLVSDLRRRCAAAPAAGLVGALDAMLGRPDSRGLLADIDVPTLVVTGDEDVLVSTAEARSMHRAIPGSRFESIARAGHLCSMERPAAFNHVTGEFLGAILCHDHA
jgi:pimeloyl-ACP methyl ester carboxylesterase